jgi:hypothetical protein
MRRLLLLFLGILFLSALALESPAEASDPRSAWGFLVGEWVGEGAFHNEGRIDYAAEETELGPSSGKTARGEVMGSRLWRARPFSGSSSPLAAHSCYRLKA